MLRLNGQEDTAQKSTMYECTIIETFTVYHRDKDKISTFNAN